MAKGFELHTLAIQTSQGGKRIEHSKEVVKMPESNMKDEEASDSHEF